MDAEFIPQKHPQYPAEDHSRNKLCIDLLNTIARSVVNFKPSKSLSCLQSVEDSVTKKSAPHAEIDIVISGGGLKGYFMAGCSHILMQELQKKHIHIARIAGTSAGAWVGMFMLTNFGTENWLETFYLCKERPEMMMHDAYNDIWPWVNSCMPENAWQICSGRLFISITEVTPFGFKNHVISQYPSNRDLFEACLASSTVPFISLSTAMRKYRGMWVVDGGITNNTPIFEDDQRRQIVFRLSDVFYPAKFLINPYDYCIESLVVRGAILMSRFLQGQDSDSFAWVYPNRTNSMMRKMRRIVWGCTLNISIFAALGGAVYYVTYSKQAQEVKELVKNEVKQILPMFREVVNWLSSFRSL